MNAMMRFYYVWELNFNSIRPFQAHAVLRRLRIRLKGISANLGSI